MDEDSTLPVGAKTCARCGVLIDIENERHASVHVVWVTHEGDVPETTWHRLHEQCLRPLVGEAQTT